MGSDRPAFVDPHAEFVRCHFCGTARDPTDVDGIDVSGDDEYYPKMVPCCPEGCR
jgi:hypothetical protein